MYVSIHIVHCITFFTTPHCTFAAVVIVSAQVQEFSNTLPDGQWACANEEVNFTCIARVQGTQSWLSYDYIGGGGRSLEFASVDSIGAQRTSTINPSVYALLINNALVGGMRFLTSVLHIVVWGGQLNQSIICRTSNNSEKESVIQILGNYFYTCMC